MVQPTLAFCGNKYTSPGNVVAPSFLKYILLNYNDHNAMFHGMYGLDKSNSSVTEICVTTTQGSRDWLPPETASSKQARGGESMLV